MIDGIGLPCKFGERAPKTASDAIAPVNMSASAFRSPPGQNAGYCYGTIFAAITGY
jgi:hypothetical protein